MTSLRLVVLLTAMFFAASSLASEDSAEYPFAEDFSFDDLPDIELPESEPQEPIAVPEKAAATVDSTTAETSAKTTDENPPELLPETRYFPGSGKVSALEKNVDAEDVVKVPTKLDVATSDTPQEKSLTETLKEDAKNSSKNLIEGTWVEKLTSSNPLSLLNLDDDDEEGIVGDELEELVKTSRNKEKTGRSNASVFDIAGVMLRMSLQQVERTMQNRGFRKVNAKFQIPNFIKWRNEEKCRNEGVVGYERLEVCVINKAKKDGYQYIQLLEYAKFDSKEEIEIYFTSTFTENKVYKIVYKSRIASITGNSPKAIYIRNIKVYDFWKKINQKYGQPDNKTTITWGMGGNKPYLKAETGFLLLEDPMFREMDYTRMSREDQRFINSDFYNF